MAIPTYDSAPIFSSLDRDGNPLNEGILEALDYQGLFQALQFNGENGTRWLSNGWPSRQWVFNGLLSAPSLNALNGLYNAIEFQIDQAVIDPVNYWKTLVDTFGNSWSRAQVRTFHKLQPTQITADGFLCHVQVTGLIQAMDPETQGGSE